MSKIGQKKITVPSTISFTVDGNKAHLKGPKGELNFQIPSVLTMSFTDGMIEIKRLNETKPAKSLHGLWRSILANAVYGVENGWSRRLEIVGTGFNVKMQGQALALKVGYSHPVIVNPIQGIQFAVEGNTIIIVSGCDKQQVGEIAFQIKSIKKPDAYKGKGIRFEGEHIRIKPGKKAKTA